MQIVEMLKSLNQNQEFLEQMAEANNHPLNKHAEDVMRRELQVEGLEDQMRVLELMWVVAGLPLEREVWEDPANNILIPPDLEEMIDRLMDVPPMKFLEEKILQQGPEQDKETRATYRLWMNNLIQEVDEAEKLAEELELMYDLTPWVSGLAEVL